MTNDLIGPVPDILISRIPATGGRQVAVAEAVPNFELNRPCVRIPV